MPRLRYDWEEAVAALRVADRRLAPLIDAVGERRMAAPSRGVTPFAALLRAIVAQQLSGRAAATIHARVVALFEDDLPAPGALAGLTEQALREAGLSRAKVAAIRDLAARTLAGEVPGARALGRMDDEAVIECLSAVRGIGRWTAQMLLIFYLGRPDVLPVQDLGVRKGMMLTHRLAALPEADEMERRARRWRPYRSVASWYLWRAVELEAS